MLRSVYNIQVQAALETLVLCVFPGPVVALLQRHHGHHGLVHARAPGR